MSADLPHSDSASAMPSGGRAEGVFATTRWSLVLGAAEESEAGRRALEELCRCYWFPIYALVRAKGVDAEPAKDLTQEFFLKLLEKGLVGRARRERGRFRHFLGTSLRNFLADEWDKARTAKRGGGAALIPLDGDEAERLWREMPAAKSPEAEFDRRWALELFAEAGRRFEREGRASGQGEILRVLRQCGDPHAPSLAEEAARLDMALNTLKSRLHRARARHAQIIREVVAETVSTPAEVEGELRELLAIVSAG